MKNFNHAEGSNENAIALFNATILGLSNVASSKIQSNNSGLQGAVKATCGPKPLFSKEKKAVWQQCAEKYAGQTLTSPTDIAKYKIDAEASSASRNQLTANQKMILIGGGTVVFFTALIIILKTI